MKILFIDDSSIQNSIRLGLLEQVAHHDVHLISGCDEALKFFTDELPDIVLIDFAVGSGLDILKKILEIKPHQPIITISDSLDCSELLGCDFCCEHYNKKRVLKDEGIHELLYLIDNFSELLCKYAYKFDSCSTKD